MKKELLVAAVLACFSLNAFAESSVSLYGTLDLGVLVKSPRKVDGKKVDTTVSMESGQFFPNIVGLKGEEDLGSNLSVGFSLEESFLSDTGDMSAPGTQFDIQSLLYVKKDNLLVAAGRMKGLSSTMGMFDYGAFMEPFEGSWINAGSSVLALIGQDVNNALAVNYSMGGLNLTAMYSLGLEAEETAPYAANRHYTGLAASYSSGPLWAALTYEFISKGHKGKVEDWASKDVNVLKAAFNYDFGFIKPFFTYSFASGNDWGWGHTVNTNSFVIGATAPLAGGTLRGSFQYLTGSKKTIGEEKFKPEITSFALGYTYPVSKRTTLYSVASYSIGGKSLKRNAKAGYVMGDFDARVNVNMGMLSIGITHNF